MGQADEVHYRTLATEIEYPEVANSNRPDLLSMPRPRTLRNEIAPDYWNLRLEEVMQITLSNSTVMRDIGGRVVSTPAVVQSVFEPALRETDPRQGPEAALSQFDAQWNTRMFWYRTERAFNNILFSGGVPALSAEGATFSTEVSKRTAAGTQLFIRNNTDYLGNNSRLNRFPSAYDTNLEAEIRQPLLQGNGILFNRIAGPNSLPGIYNGVMVARINTDISLADFEAAVTGLVRDVERTYWDLYFAYRDLDAKIAARDFALQTWRSVNRRYEVGAVGGDEETESRAREQYYLFQGLAENALSGTVSNITGGQAVGQPGVYTLELRLRQLMGLPASDGRLIRPADEPATSEVVFDWEHSVSEALVRRVELRRQKWVIKRRELELLASRNFLLPRLDGVALYRWRGFGDHLLDPSRDGPEFNDAWGNLTQGDFQDWQLGFQANVPIGNRIGAVSVRNAELQVARERAILREQELQVTSELSVSMVEVDRAYKLMRTSYNRRMAAFSQFTAVRKKYDAGETSLDFLLDAERRLADAQSGYFRALIDYNLANMNAHFSRGSLLDYNGVFLAEGPWPGRAHRDAADHARHLREGKLDYCCTVPGLASRGAYQQNQLEPAQHVEEIRQGSPSLAPGNLEPSTVPAGPAPLEKSGT